MIRVPPKVKTGDPIRASDFNALIEAVQTLASIRATAPLRIETKGGGLTIAIDRVTRSYDAVITARNGPAAPANPSAYTYKYRVLDKPEMGEIGFIAPDFRSVRNDEVKIHPASVGDPVRVFIYPTDTGGTVKYLDMLNAETPAWGDCE